MPGQIEERDTPGWWLTRHPRVAALVAASSIAVVTAAPADAAKKKGKRGDVVRPHPGQIDTYRRAY